MACQICNFPTEKRIACETAIKQGDSYRKIQEQFGVNKNTAMRHKNSCLKTPIGADSPQDKLRKCALALEKKGDFKGAGDLWKNIIVVGDGDDENVFHFLGIVAPRLCDSCRKLILRE
jgi:hypothetical protein